LYELGSQLGQLGGRCVQVGSGSIPFSGKGFDVTQQGSKLLGQVFACIEGMSKLDGIVVPGMEHGRVEVIYRCSGEGLEATGIICHDSDNGKGFGLIVSGE
jgi:hypothetical protein